MPGNVLTGEVRIIAPNAKQAFNDVADGVKKTEVAINRLNPDITTLKQNLSDLKTKYAALNDTQKNSSFANQLRTDIRNANIDLKILESQTTSTSQATSVNFTSIGRAATGALSSLRQFAYILPGIGVAGILGGFSDLVIGLFDTSDAFDKIDLAAAHFDNTMRQLKDDVENFKNILDFEGKIEKISLELSGLTGTKLQGAQTGVDIGKSVDQVFELTGAIKKLTEQNDNLVKTRTEFEKTVNSFGKTTELAKLITQFGQLSDLPETAVKKLSKADQELVREYQKRTDEIKALSKQRDAAFQGGLLSGSGLAIPTIREENKAAAKEKIKREIPKLGSFDLELVPILSDKPDLSKIRLSIKKLEDVINQQSSFDKINLSLPGKAFQNLQGTGAAGQKDAAKELIDQYKGLAAVITDVVTPAFQGFFDAVANGGNAFKAFAKAAGQALIAVIEKLAIAAVLGLILSSVTGLGTAIGAGGDKFKDIFKFLSGFGGARATGGPVQSGKGYLVGENGPEWFAPNTGGRIVANDQLGSGMSSRGGMKIAVAGEFIQRGQDLIAVITLANQSKARLI